MADVKVVRLQAPGGAVVETSEENAARLIGFEPVKAESKSTGKSTSSKSK